MYVCMYVCMHACMHACMYVVPCKGCVRDLASTTLTLTLKPRKCVASSDVFVNEAMSREHQPSSYRPDGKTGKGKGVLVKMEAVTGGM